MKLEFYFPVFFQLFNTPPKIKMSPENRLNLKRKFHLPSIGNLRGELLVFGGVTQRMQDFILHCSCGPSSVLTAPGDHQLKCHAWF